MNSPGNCAARQRILVTGAAGTIGRMLVSRLQRDGRLLRLLDLDTDGLVADEGVELMVGRRIHSTRESIAIGFRPIDDAEIFAEEILAGLSAAASAQIGAAGSGVHTYLGGGLFTTVEIGMPM